MVARYVRVVAVVACLFVGAFVLAQDVGLVSPPSIEVCGEGTFTITVNNPGVSPADDITNVFVTATLPANYEYYSASGLPNTAGLPDVVWTVGNLAGGASWSETITIGPNCDAITGETLLVTVDYTDSLLNPQTLTDTSPSILVTEPNLVIELTDGIGGSTLVQTREVGDTAEWYIRVINTGPGRLNNVTLDATFGVGLTDTSGIVWPVAIGDIDGYTTYDFSAVEGTVTATVDDCTDIKTVFTAEYDGCDGVSTNCIRVTDEVEGSVELLYNTPNLQYDFYDSAGVATLAHVDIPYCGSYTVMVRVTNPGANAGNIRNLTFEASFPEQLVVLDVYDTDGAYNVTYTFDHYDAATYANVYIIAVENNNPALDYVIAPGDTVEFYFEVEWENRCFPADCEDLVFEPFFLDDCGEDFYPPVKELSVGDAPTAPYFTVVKTGPANLDEGDTDTYTVTVTLDADAIASVDAQVQDTFPESFTATNADRAGVIDNSSGVKTVTWPVVTFAPGVPEVFTFDLTASYVGTDCAVGVENYVEMINVVPICYIPGTPPIPCPVTPDDDTLNLVGDDLLAITKTDPNGDGDTLYMDGVAATYRVTVDYDGPLCDIGGTLQTPPITVVDTYPLGGYITNYIGSPIVPTVSTSPRTITWDIPAGYVGGFPVVLEYDMAIDSINGAGYTPDACICGTVVSNTVTAALTDGVCIICNAAATSASFNVGVDCDNEVVAPFTSSKVANPGVEDLCDCITYTNTLTFNSNIVGSAWSDIEFTENGDNNQLFDNAGTYETIGPATFTLNSGAPITQNITLGTPIDLGFLPGSPADGDVLEIEYTICFTGGATPSTPGDFVDWSDFEIDGFLNDECSTDNEFHEGCWVTARDLPPNLGVSTFCHYVGGDCSSVIRRCEESLFTLHLNQSNPSYGVRIEVDLNGDFTDDGSVSYYDYVGPDTPEDSGILAGYYGVLDTATPGRLIWDVGDLTGSGDGSFSFYLQKNCDADNRVEARVIYYDTCGVESISSLPYEAGRTWGGDILIKKTPEVIFVTDRITPPEWVLYVTNRGSGPAFYVDVIDVLGEGLEYDAGNPYTITGVDAGATVTFTETADSPAPGQTTLEWVISYIPPGETVEIALPAYVVDCNNRTNDVYALWGCGAVGYCDTTAPVHSEVEELTTKVTITQHSSTDVDLCKNNVSTGTIKFRNIGESNAYSLVVSEQLPPGLEYLPGSYTIDCDIDCGVGVNCCENPASFSYNAGTRTLTWEFWNQPGDVGMSPGAEYTITFDYELSTTGCVDYVDGSGMLMDLAYETVCGDAKTAATNSLSTREGNPEIEVTKSPDPVYGEPGDTISWDIELDSIGTMTAYDVVLTDTLPTNTTFHDIIENAGNPLPTPGMGAPGPWNIPDLDPGDVYIYTIEAEIIAGGCDVTLDNTAGVDWGCCAGESDSAPAGLVTIPNVIRSQSLSGDITSCGGTLVIEFSNDGTDAYNPTVVNDIPPGFRHVNGNTTIWSDLRGWLPIAGSDEPANAGGIGTVTWLPANFDGVLLQNETITITFDIVNSDATNCSNDKSGTNDVTISFDDDCGGTTTMTTISLDLSVNAPVVTIDKDPNFQTVPPGGYAEWTIEIDETNGGEADGTVTITDELGGDYVLGTIVAPNITDYTGYTATPAITQPGGAGTPIFVEWTGLSLDPNGDIDFTLRAYPDTGSLEANLYNTVTVTIECGACTATTAFDTVYTGYSNITKDIIPLTATIGEIVPIEIVTTYYGSTTGYTNVIVEDVLPADMTYVAGSWSVTYVGADAEPTVTFGSYNVGTNTVTWNLAGFIGPTDDVHILFNAMVLNTATSDDGDTLTNTASTSYDVAGSSFIDTATDTMDLVEPLLTITKSDGTVGTAVVDAGDTITYTITLNNTGTSTAYDVVVTDVIPAGLSYVTASITGTGADDTGAPNLQWDIPSIAVGGTEILTYTVTVDDGVQPAEVLDNDANVIWRSLDTTNGEERNGSGAPAYNDYSDTAQDSLVIDTAHNITKTLITPAGGNVTVGSEVTYRIVYDLPDATIPRVVIADTIGEGLRYYSGINYAEVTFPDGSTVFIDPSVVGNNGAPGTSTLTWEWVNDGRIAPVAGVMGDLEIEFTVLVANVIENQDGDSIPNGVSGTYYDTGGTPHTDTDTSANVTVNEPVITIDKDDGTGGIDVDAGDTITYTITLNNTGSWTAYDVVVTDVIPGGLTYVAASITGTGADDSGAPNLQWDIPSIAVGGTVVLSYQVTVGDGVEPAEVLWNDASVEWTSLSGTPTPDEERNGTDGLHNSGVLNDYSNEDQDSLVIDTAHNITKTLVTPAGGNVTVGSEVTYRIVYDLPDATIPRVVITDTIGEGLRYYSGINYAEVTFPDGSTAFVDPAIVGNNGAPGTSTLTWEWVNDGRIAPVAGVMADLEIEFTVLVANVIENQDGDSIPNGVSGTYYDTGGTPHTDTDTSANVTVNEPVITIDKDDGTGGITVEAGDTITYTITLNNSGSWTAYDVVVEDVIPAGLTYVAASITGTGADDTGTPNLSWDIPSIAVGATFVLSYQVTVDGTVQPNEILWNDASVEWTSLSGTPAPDEERNGTDGLHNSGVLNDYSNEDAESVTIDTTASITKTLTNPVGGSVTISSIVTYEIEMELPDATIPSLTITDTMGDWIEYVSTTSVTMGGVAVTSPFTLTPSGQDLTWEFTNLDASGGGTLNIIFTAQVMNIDANDDLDTIPNTAEYYYEGFGAYTQSGGPDSATDLTIHVPALTITKTIASIIGVDGTNRTALAVVEPGDRVTFDITINNVGSGRADNVIVTDSVLPEFTYVAGSATTPAGVSVVGPNPLVWTITSIPGYGSETVSFSMDATSAIVEGTVYTNYTITTGVDELGNTIPADNTDHVPVDTFVVGGGGVPEDSDTASVTARKPILSLDKEVISVNGIAWPGLLTVQPGDYIIYRVTVNNTGTGTAYNVDISDTLPTGLGYGDHLAPIPPPPLPPTLPSGTYTDASWTGGYGPAPYTHDSAPTSPTGTITWDGSAIRPLGPTPVTGIILPGGESYTLDYVVYVNSGIVQGLPVDNLAESECLDGAGTTVPSNTDTTTLFTREPFLVTEKEVTAIDGDPANTTVAVVGSIVEYTVTIENVGDGDALNVNIFDTMPLGFVYVPGSATIGDPTAIVGDELQWLNNYTIIPGGIVSFTFELEVTSATSGGDQINTMWAEGIDGAGTTIITDGSAITPLDTDDDDSDVAPVYVDIPTLPLVLTKTATPRSVSPGGVVRYTVTFTNNRKIEFYNVTITDVIPSGFTYLPGTSVLDGVSIGDPSGAGTSTLTWIIGTVAPETKIVLEYHVLASHAASSGANVNYAGLSMVDGAGRKYNLNADATVSVKRGVGFPLASILMPGLPPFGGTESDVPEGWGERPGERREGEDEDEEERRPECCINVRKIAIRSQDFGDTLPGYPEIYYQTDIAMYAATELFIIEDYLSNRLALTGIDPDEEYLMTGLYNRVVEKLGEYAQYNLGNVIMQSELGIPMRFTPTMRETILNGGVSPETAAEMLLADMARASGLDEVPNIEPIFLEYFGSYPYLEDRIVSGELAWSEGLMDKNIMPAALGMTLLRTSHQLPEFLESPDPMDRFFGRLMLMLSLEKLEAISSEMMVVAEFSPPVAYLPHYSLIEMNETDGTLEWTVVDETSSLYDHASMLWGLSKFRSVVIHSSEPDVRASLDVITERLDEIYTAFEAVHYDEETGEYKSLHAPGGGDDERVVTALDLGYTVLAMRSIYNDNRDLRMNSHEPMRRIVDICDFMIENMTSKLDGGVYTSYDYAEGAPDTGTKRTLVDNSLAIRAFLSAYAITGDETYREAALDVYDFMVENIWVEEHAIFADEERWDYDVVMTPQNIGATMGALRELTLYGDDREIIDYLDRMALLTERILDQSQLQLYENRFFPWHSPVTLIPEDPNGRSYIKPIITPIRDRSITRDLAPILVRKMVLNLTPGGAIASGNEDTVYDFNKWKSDLRYEVPDLIASSLADDTFITDTGMYFSSLIHDYRDNLSDELPTYDPYIADPEIQTYGVYLSDEVSRFNVKNLTINSRMGIELIESSLIADLADDRRMNPDDYLEAFLNARVPQMDEEYESGFLAPIFGKVKELTEASIEDRFGHVVYLEYASGKPFYTDGITDGWDEDTFDESLRVSSIAQTMIRQLMLIEDYEGRDDLFSGDIFVRDVMVLTAAAKRRFLSDLAAHAEDDKLNHIPHTFDMVWDDDLDRYLPEAIDTKSDLFDHVSLIWAVALWIDARERGFFDQYNAYLDDREADEELLDECIDDLIENHYSEAYGTLVTGSVDTIEVSRALDVLTRAAALLPDGEAKDRLITLIENQADYIISNILTETGTVPLVDFGGDVPYDTQCLMERLGTNVFPILALIEAYEVTGNERFLHEALPAFIRFDHDKWVQELGLYLSTGTIYEQSDWSKVELEYTNTELISTVLLISALQPYMEGEDKILTAFHMTTFMNRLLEISSLERYPGNDESDMEIFSPQIINKVKIILEASEGAGEPGGVFTFLIAIDTDCVIDTDVNHGLSRIRIEDTIPEGFYYVAGSTTINGRPSPDPVGTKTLNWYAPIIGNDSTMIIRYQLIADEDNPPGYYVNDLDVISFWQYRGELYPCDATGIEETIRLVDDLWIDSEEECLPCRYGELTLPK